MEESSRFRASAQILDEDFKACVALQAQYILDTFGKFPGTVPTLFIMNYVQAHHLDLDFYDRFFKPDAYLRTHAEHMRRRHGQPKGERLASTSAPGSSDVWTEQVGAGPDVLLIGGLGDSRWRACLAGVVDQHEFAWAGSAQRPTR